MAAFNPKNYAGYHGNAQRIVDVSTTIGSNVLTSPGGGFTGALVGQTIWVSGRLQQTTIGAVVSNNEVHSVLPAESTGSLCECVFGGDDTPAFKLAFTAATAGGRKTTFEPPNANCIITDRFFSYSGSYPPNIVGEDDGTCVMFISPNIAIPNDGTGVVIKSIGGGNRFANFSLWFPFSLYIMFDDQAMLQADGGGMQFHNLQAINCNATGYSGYIRTYNGNLHASATYIYTFNDAPGSLISPGNTCRGWLQNNMSGVMEKPFFSNLYSGLDVSNLITRQGVGGTATMQITGGWGDENGGPPANVVLRNGASLQMIGTTIWVASAPGNYAVSVDATSKLWLRDCGLGPYAINTAGARALKIDLGGYVRASGSTFWCTDSDSDICVQNDGVFEDMGGNDYKQQYPSLGHIPTRRAVANQDQRFISTLAGHIVRSRSISNDG